MFACCAGTDCGPLLDAPAGLYLNHFCGSWKTSLSWLLLTLWVFYELCSIWKSIVRDDVTSPDTRNKRGWGNAVCTDPLVQNIVGMDIDFGLDTISITTEALVIGVDEVVDVLPPILIASTLPGKSRFLPDLFFEFWRWSVLFSQCTSNPFNSSQWRYVPKKCWADPVCILQYYRRLWRTDSWNPSINITFSMYFP